MQMNNKCNYDMCCNSLKYGFTMLLVSILIVINIFLCIFIGIDQEEEESCNGSIIAFSSTSSTGISLATSSNGTPLNMSILSHGHGQNISAADIGSNDMNTLNFNLQEVPWETSFVMPRSGEITSISFSYTNGIETNCNNLDTRMIVKLYTAPANSEVFSAIPEATFELDKVLNGMLLQNEVITGSIKNLSIPVEADTKLLLGIYIQSNRPDNIQVDLLGAAHAGINIK